MFRRMIACMLCLTLLIAAGCTAETGGERDKEGMIMTEFQRQVLTVTGADPETFDMETARPAERNMLESALFAENYLAEKYPEVEFSVEGYIPAELMQNYDEFRIVTVGEDPVSFTVQVSENDGSAAAADNYYGALKTAEYEEMIEELIEAETGIAADVSASIVCHLGSEFNGDMPVEVAAVRSEFFAYTWILISPEAGDFGAAFEKIQTVLAEKGFGGEYTIFHLIEPLPVGITRAQEDELILSHKSTAPVYHERESFTVFAKG